MKQLTVIRIQIVFLLSIAVSLALLLAASFLTSAAYATEGARYQGSLDNGTSLRSAAYNDETDFNDIQMDLDSLYLYVYTAYDTKAAGGCNYYMKTVKYTGKAITPHIVVAYDEEGRAEEGPTYLTKLKQGVDYKLTFKNNVKVGTASVTITGLGLYAGKVTKKFKIAYPINKAKTSRVAKRSYTGKAQKPVPVVKYKGKKLKKGVDYTLSYKANKKVGTARIIITGKGSYTGTKTIKFKIVKKRRK